MVDNHAKRVLRLLFSGPLKDTFEDNALEMDGRGLKLNCNLSVCVYAYNIGRAAPRVFAINSATPLPPSTYFRRRKTQISTGTYLESSFEGMMQP